MFIKLPFVVLFAVASVAQARRASASSMPVCPTKWGRHNRAAFAFAKTVGLPTRLRPTDAGAWQAADGRFRAPEEFDVIWYHQGDEPTALIGDAAESDLKCYLESGGALLLSGAAGQVLNELNIEPSPLRLLGPTNAAFVSGFRVAEKHRGHPAFAGFDTAQADPADHRRRQRVGRFLRHSRSARRVAGRGQRGSRASGRWSSTRSARAA